MKSNNSAMSSLLRKSRRAFTLLIFVALAYFGCGTSANADRIVPFSDDWFNRQYDWTVYLSLAPMDKFLQYPNSGMTPIMRVPVEYRFSPKRNFRKNYPLERQKYEELWYHAGRAVGLKRYSMMPFMMDEQGALYVTPDQRNGQNIREITNAIVRLVLDIYARRTILATIVVPQEYFETIASELTQYNFFKLTIVYPGGPGNNMSIHLVSEPFGLERYFYYDDSGRR